MWLVLFMPWAIIGAFGCTARNSFHTDVPEEPADTRDAPLDPILSKSLVHEVWVAARQVWPEDRALTQPELLDEQCEADGDLSAARPRGDVDRFTHKAGDGVDSVLRQGHGGKVHGEQQRHSDDEASLPGLPSHGPSTVMLKLMEGRPSSWRQVRA